MDEDIRLLEKSTDPLGHYKWRVAMVRAGHEVKPMVGDLVEVEETESPWVRGKWVGIVRRTFEQGDNYISPICYPGFRVKPSLKYYNDGLYLTRKDLVRVLRPALPKEEPC